MPIDPRRRSFVKLAGMAGVVAVSGLAGCAARAGRPEEDFSFVQLSDTHWGFSGPAVNPEARTTLPRAIAAVNAMRPAPDFVVFTGDLTHTTDDPAERRRRMAEFREQVAALTIAPIRYLPGEHDASLDRGEAFREFFGESRYRFEHKGVAFLALDNVSDAGARLGEEQLAWLSAQVAALPRQQPLVVFAHRPLFPLYPQWDWATRDGQQAIEILQRHPNVTVFYGHIHQEHHFMTGAIAHHAARSLIFPLPAPGSRPARTPLPWDPAAPFRGLGWRDVEDVPDHTRLVEKGIA